MIFIAGDTRSGELVAELERLGWGRMIIASDIQPYPGEPWAVDNGAFGAWNNGHVWNGWEFLVRLREIHTQYPARPYFAVCPDKVADPDSLRFSLAWMARIRQMCEPVEKDGLRVPGELPEAIASWDWYFAVQDGMELGPVAEALPLFAGLFLGGTKKWKKRTAKQWVQLARQHGKRAHYARCSVEADLRLAQRLGYDSADSAFLLWTRERFYNFVRMFGGESAQKDLFSCLA